MAPYCASKYGVVGMSEALDAELRPRGIRVIAVCPGVIDTPLAREGTIMRGQLSDNKAKIVVFYDKHGASPDTVAADEAEPRIRELIAADPRLPAPHPVSRTRFLAEPRAGVPLVDQTGQYTAVPPHSAHSGYTAKPWILACQVKRSHEAVMKRLNGVDAFMLGMETSKSYMHTFKVAIIDPSTDPEGWSFDKFYEESARRIHLVPILRWKYLDSPLGLNHPYWVEDPDFNLHYHIRRVACPPPADHKSLCEFMAAIYSYQLDRNRPLWMTWVVEGLADGKVACVMLVHHAYVDGVGASWLMQRFYQPQPGIKAGDPPAYNPPPLPSWLTRLGWALRDWPGVTIGNMPKVAMGLWHKFMLDRKRKLAGLPPHPSAGQMRQTPINVTLSAGRTFVCDSIPLERFVTVSRALNVTINDVFTNCVAGAVRRLLVDLHYNPDAHPLIGATPFAGERPAGREGWGNFATQDFCWLRSDITDPLKRLQASHEANVEMKEHIREVKEAGADISSVMQVVPPWGIPLIRKAIHRRGGSFGLFGNLVLSNVPGPKEALYLDNWKLANWYSTGQIADGTGLNITMWSYCGQANICMLIDREVLKDGWRLFNYFVDELNALVAVTNAKEAAR